MEEAKTFFRPQMAHLHNLSCLMIWIKQWKDSIKRWKKRKILIYGDYDVDGTTAVALVYKFYNNFIQISIFTYLTRYNRRLWDFLQRH